MKIEQDGVLIATIKRFSDWKKNLDFVTSDDAFIQVGTWHYDKGRVLDRHEHNIVDRKSNITQECVFVVSGKMLVKFFDHNRKFVKSITLNQFDYAVIFSGGHEYEILENDTRILECKNGPFPGVTLDKTRY